MSFKSVMKKLFYFFIIILIFVAIIFLFKSESDEISRVEEKDCISYNNGRFGSQYYTVIEETDDYIIIKGRLDKSIFEEGSYIIINNSNCVDIP